MQGPAPITQAQTVHGLKTASEMEITTVTNSIAASVKPDGVLSDAVKSALADEIPEELGRARRLATRTKELGGTTPTTAKLDTAGSHVSPNARTLVIELVARDVVADETDACHPYRSLIAMTDGKAPAPQGLCTAILANEERHRATFAEFHADY